MSICSSTMARIAVTSTTTSPRAEFAIHQSCLAFFSSFLPARRAHRQSLIQSSAVWASNLLIAAPMAHPFSASSGSR
jgi:hypothetical protein